MSDWLARKLAERANQPPSAPAYPGYPQPGQQPQTVAPQVWASRAPGQAPPTVPYGMPGGPPTPPPVQQIDPNDPSLGLSAYSRAALAVGDKGRTSACPECRKDSLYQVTTGENGMPLRNIPAPTCMNCGWPYNQAGSIHGGASALKPMGATKQARQLAQHVVQVYDDRGRVVDSYEPQRSGQGGSYV